MWFPHHHWMYPLDTMCAQSVAKSCVMKIHFVLLQNTTSALTASNNHNAITLFHGYQENKTQRGFLLGGVGLFLSPLSCSVNFAVWGASLTLLVLSRVDGQLFVPVSSCHPGGFAFAARTEPSRGTTGKDSPEQGGVGEWGPTVWQLCCKCLWQKLPLELCWSCHRSWSHGPPAPPVFSLYEREAVE